MRSTEVVERDTTTRCSAGGTNPSRKRPVRGCTQGATGS